MDTLSQGAEAIIFTDRSVVLKQRVEKSYRHPELDLRLRKFRTRREGKIFSVLEGVVLIPKLIAYSDKSLVDDKSMTLKMQYLDGKRVRDVLNSRNISTHCFNIGKMVAKMHNLNVIHGDLTTSNLIYAKKKIHLIDFGLSFFSKKYEDKAVDIHLFRQTLLATHPILYEKGYRAFLDSYATEADEASIILKRLDEVEHRGRYKMKEK